MEPRIVHNQTKPEYFFKEGCHIREWWNSSLDGSASIARVRVEPGTRTRLHRLSGVTERYAILSGKGMAEIGTSAPEEVGPGDVVIIPPGVPQRISNRETEDLIFLAICTPRFSEEVYEDLG
jgi:mannose-6-phosphate isomerase-like protein (cupin superfamily)